MSYQEKDGTEMIDIDDIFAYNVALSIMEENEDIESTSVEKWKHRNDGPKWKNAIKAELNSLAKREVFRPIVCTPNDIKPMGYK